MRALSKSQLVAYRQCPKRMWLEVHRPELREESAATAASFAAGDDVGKVVRTLYDTLGIGETIDVEREGYDRALSRTTELLEIGRPIFEAGFRAAGVIAFADGDTAVPKPAVSV